MAQVIIVGGGLAGLSAAHTLLERGANVLLLDKQGFMGGNSTKATSGINGAGTATQQDNKITDSAKIFFEEADLLDPIVGSCFAACASVLANEITRVEAWVAVGSSDVRAQVSTLLSAMSHLNVRFPLVGFQIARIQRMIPVL